MQVSPARIKANRANAQKSTGPKDTSNSRNNGITHGMTACHAVLPWEHQQDFDASLAALVHHYRPIDHAEYLIVKRAAEAFWRSERGKRLEINMFDTAALAQLTDGNLEPNDVHRGHLEAIAFTKLGSHMDRLCRYEAHLERMRRNAERSLKEMVEARKVLQPIPQPPPEPVAVSTEAACGYGKSKLKMALLRSPTRRPGILDLKGRLLRLPIREQLEQAAKERQKTAETQAA